MDGPSRLGLASGGAGLVKGMLGGLLFGRKSQLCCFEVYREKVDRAKERAKGGGERSSAFVERDVDSENIVTLPRTRWTSCQPTTW